ncbi:MAG TPA: glutamate--tRNA ligase, partial [Gammaproteobacteria bacterium]|nr:glutamate--tRNA ligase [Gammaproteobacteria bacterium]
MAELREAGFFPEAVTNYLARLGHHMEEGDLFSLQALAERFETDRLTKAPARFDADQLAHWNHEAVVHAEPERLWEWVAPGLATAVPEERRMAWVAAVQPNLEAPADGETWARVCFGEMDVSADARAEIEGADAALWPAAEAALVEHGTDFKAVTKAVQAETGLKGRQLFKPLRAALTGCTAGPELGPLLALMGAETAQARVRAARKEDS